MNHHPETLVAVVFALMLTPFASAQNTPVASQVGSENVDFRTSCADAATDDFNRAVALMHSFWFADAIEGFNDVLAMDADCAIAHWGIALSHWGNPFAGQRNEQQLERGRAAVYQARQTGSPTPRETQYIEAVAELFADNISENQYQRTLAYEDAMQTLVTDFPDDREGKIFYALAINQNAQASDKTYARQLAAAEILEPMFAAYPGHPGLAHYIIHAYDHPPLAERALNAAQVYASLAPDAPHALHMPSHTFTRVGMWPESVDTNLRAAQAARNDDDVGSELHALDYLTYAYLQMGRDEAAAAVVERALSLTEQVDITAVGATQAGAFAIAAIPARYALEREDFSAAAKLTVNPANTPHTQAMTHFARALGAARNGDVDAARTDIDMLRVQRTRAQENNDDYWREQIDIQLQVASAWVMFVEGNHDEGIAQLRRAAEAEDNTDKSAISPGPLAPARELLGVMLLAAGFPELALSEFEASMQKEPKRFLALKGAALAAHDAGGTEAARGYYEELLTVAATADSDRPALRRARAYLIH
jgi:tetratricopeptide (TPR) repeat protein